MLPPPPAILNCKRMYPAEVMRNSASEAGASRGEGQDTVLPPPPHLLASPTIYTCVFFLEEKNQELLMFTTNHPTLGGGRDLFPMAPLGYFHGCPRVAESEGGDGQKEETSAPVVQVLQGICTRSWRRIAQRLAFSSCRDA